MKISMFSNYPFLANNLENIKEFKIFFFCWFNNGLDAWCNLSIFNNYLANIGFLKSHWGKKPFIINFTYIHTLRKASIWSCLTGSKNFSNNHVNVFVSWICVCLMLCLYGDLVHMYDELRWVGLSLLNMKLLKFLRLIIFTRPVSESSH